MTYDLHECNKTASMEYARWVATPISNVNYAIAKAKKQVFEKDSKYPRGTFFVITENGEKPQINRKKISEPKT